MVIVGAGPAGLTAAHELLRRGHRPIVLEQDPIYVGGIAKTVAYRGYRFDIGGHRFFSKNAEVEALWSELLGDDMLTCQRLSRIYYRGRYFAYPIQARNALWNLGPVEATRCLVSYAAARLRPVPNPRTFAEWVRNQFGQRLFEIFFKTYTEKVWGMPTDELSADWAAQRIKGLDLGTVVRSAFRPASRRPVDAPVIKTLIDAFRYPRLGPGQCWERVATQLSAAGMPVRHGHTISRVHHRGGRVTAVTATTPDGPIRLDAGAVLSTMPLRELVLAMEPPAPEPVETAARALTYRDFLTVALVVDRPTVFSDNWIYIHEPGVQVGRIQNFKNWSSGMVADPTRSCLGLEYFCFEGDGLWTMTDNDLVSLATRELVKLGMCASNEVLDGTVVRQAKAYPVYDDDYQVHVQTIRDWLATTCPNLAVA
ncbi:MAG TPA: NAD(P)/FAD-dependent oxidoreductase, partial [Candidatus Dormibacteraeota bacterium]|nr:NAD(P)/FAD-dependent oxidoreductase [Candidatus Dormibacteraeota bacterium]